MPPEHLVLAQIWPGWIAMATPTLLASTTARSLETISVPLMSLVLIAIVKMPLITAHEQMKHMQPHLHCVLRRMVLNAQLQINAIL